jgi:DNA-binding response OmpR family regulator
MPSTKTSQPQPKLRVPMIVYAEHNHLLMRLVRDVLELAGWRVEHCYDGIMARATMECVKGFDLLLPDNELPSMTGLELTVCARRLAHLKHTPIILLSLEDCADEARRAGASEFIRKPHNIHTLVDTIRCLLPKQSKGHTTG